MLRWLLRYFALDDPYAADKRVARLREDQALSIAMKAGARVSDAYELEFVGIERQGDDLLWMFETNSRGSAWHVKVRDRDGKVVSHGRTGLR
jgi:hypothetical protein